MGRYNWKDNVSALNWPYLIQMIIGKVLVTELTYPTIVGLRRVERVPRMVCELELGRMGKSELHVLQMRSRIASIGFAVRRKEKDDITG